MLSVVQVAQHLSHHGWLEEDVQGLPDVPGPVAALQVGARELKVVVDGPHVLVGAAQGQAVFWHYSLYRIL